MKKRITTIATILLMAAVPTMAQVFLTEEEEMNYRCPSEPGSIYVELPGTYNSGADWYTPIGEGLVVLAGLAGAYLLGKRSRKE